MFAEGLTVGLAEVEVKPVGLLVQEYVLPVMADAPIVVELPGHIELLAPAFAAGSAFTFTTTAPKLLQPVVRFTSCNM